MKKICLPFGMIFAEIAPNPYGEQMPTPEYDPAEGISYVATDCGDRVPYISLSIYGLGTQTITEVRTETTDSDPGDRRAILATQTETKVRSETTETDPGDDYAVFGTQTETRIQSESTDTD